MSDIVPRLDTIEFDELVEQARGDIPRYAPDWTDHNLHDPGMTLIDLLAWIVDQQVYRAGFVGGRHHQAFASLLGERFGGPQPASGLVWPDRAVIDGRFVEVGSAVVCRQHADLSFVLGWPGDAVGEGAQPRSVYFPPATLTGVGLAVDGVELPAPSARTEGGSWAFGHRGGTAGTDLTLRFDAAVGSPVEPVSVVLGIEVAPPPGPPLSAGDRPWGPVVYSYRTGVDPWVEVEVLHDGTAGLAGTGAVVLAVPPVPSAGAGSSELRLRLDGGFFPMPPEIRVAAINVIPVVQRERVRSASLDDGTGQPDQMVPLDTADVVRPPSGTDGHGLTITVTARSRNPQPERWEERPELSRSGPDDPHYVVRPGYLLFGNGVNGRRPERGAQIVHAELARTRGAAGNVRGGLSWSVPALGSNGAPYGRNRQPLTGGADATGVDDLEIAAREAAVQRSALLTDDELATAARGLTGMVVGRAEVVARFDRRLPGRQVDGVRTLVVLPRQLSDSDTDGDRPRRLVQAAQAYLDEVAARLAPRRVLGERLIVQGPVAVPVDVSLTITIQPGRVARDVSTAVRRAVRSRLSAVAVSETVGPWPLGRELTVCDVEAIAANVPGVGTVPLVRLATAGGPLGDADAVRVPRDGVVVANEVEVLVVAAGSRPADRPSRRDPGRGSSR
jgi:hypothetical protein